MNNYIQIGNRKIGKDFKPFVIPEIGINHGGSLKVAIEMVDAAYAAGAEVIKHQTHVIDDEMSKAAKKIVPGNANESIYEIMSKCALSEDDEVKLKKYVESKEMIFLSTPFSRAAADRLERMDVRAYKIGSGEMNNLPLLDYIAAFGKPMIVSTGMNDLRAVHKAVDVLNKRNVKFALLHTTNLYPTPPELVRLGAMQELEREFSNVVFGLSDHTKNNNACIAAIALGASIIERHFTDSKNRVGPDIICSMTQEELSTLLKDSEEVAKMRGGKKVPAKEEQVTIDFAFATVVAIKKIVVGEIFSSENTWVKRPGTGGILAEDYLKIIGKKAKKDILFDDQISWDDVSL